MCKLWGSAYAFYHAFLLGLVAGKYYQPLHSTKTSAKSTDVPLGVVVTVVAGRSPQLDWPRPQITGGCLIHLVLLNTGPLLVDQYHAHVRIPSSKFLQLCDLKAAYSVALQSEFCAIVSP